MNKYKRLIEWMKSTAIALLLALAVFLGAQTGLFNDFFKSIPLFGALAGALRDNQTAPAASPGEILSEAAKPYVIVITASGGGHYGMRYDSAALARDYLRTSSVFIEAISTALPPSEITEDEWRASLGSPGVYFEYSSPVQLSVLAGWLGVTPAGGLDAYAVRRACVTFDGDMNTLLFESGGSFYSCGTATPGGRPSGLDGYLDNGVMFAFETGIECSFAPYTLISPETEHPVLLSDLTLSSREMIDAVLLSLDMSGQLESSYSKRGDSLVFLGQSFTLTAVPGGRVTLRGTVGDPDTDPVGDGQIIERARAVVAGTIGRHAGVADPYFCEIETDGQTKTVTFRYHAAGGIVHLYEDGCAARITFTNGAISGMELIFRTFSETGETEKLLPELLTLAAAKAEFSLCYPDTGGGSLRPIWTLRSEGS